MPHGRKWDCWGPRLPALLARRGSGVGTGKQRCPLLGGLALEVSCHVTSNVLHAPSPHIQVLWFAKMCTCLLLGFRSSFNL